MPTIADLCIAAKEKNFGFDVMSSYHDLGYSTGKQSTHKAFTCNNISILIDI